MSAFAWYALSGSFPTAVGAAPTAAAVIQTLLTLNNTKATQKHNEGTRGVVGYCWVPVSELCIEVVEARIARPGPRAARVNVRTPARSLVSRVRALAAPGPAAAVGSARALRSVPRDK